MKIIAIPVDRSNQIEDHFGQCEFYQIYTVIEGNKIVEVKTLESEQSCGCKSNIATVLAENGVTLMLAGSIGQGAINVLNLCNIEVFRGCSGDPATNIKEYLNGAISDSGITCANHQEDHQCSH